MVSPDNVAEFHTDYDIHPGDRIELFRAIASFGPAAGQSTTEVLYPGSYVDIAPSVWFDEVIYVDSDRRAARFFAHADEVTALIDTKRRAVGRQIGTTAVRFVGRDYQTDLPIDDQSVDLLVSLYAGFVSEHCTRYLRVGGTLLVNPSHGDAAMASIDPRYELVGVVNRRGQSGAYRVGSDELDRYLVPKRDHEITVDSLHASGRGVAYTRSPFAYLFERKR